MSVPATATGVDRAAGPRARASAAAVLDRSTPRSLAILLLSVLEVITGADDLTSSGTISATLIATMPIMLAGLGGLWSERAGIVNIGLEGMMILGTYGAGYFGYHYGAVGRRARRDLHGHARWPDPRRRHGHLRCRPHHQRCRDQHHRARLGAVPRVADVRRAPGRRVDAVAEDRATSRRSRSNRSATRCSTSRRRTGSSSPRWRPSRAPWSTNLSSLVLHLAAAARRDLVGAVADVVRPAAPGVRRVAVGGRVARREGAALQVRGGADLRRSRRPGWRRPGDGGGEQLPRRPDRWSRLHRPRGDDLRQLATGRPAGRLRAVRLHRDPGSAAGRRVGPGAAARGGGAGPRGGLAPGSPRWASVGGDHGRHRDAARA